MAPLEGAGAFNRQAEPEDSGHKWVFKETVGPQPAPVFSGRSCDDWHFPAGSHTVAIPKHQVPTAPEPLRPRQAFLVLSGLFWAFSIVTES